MSEHIQRNNIDVNYTVNCLFFVSEKFSSLRLLTKIFHPKIFLTLNFSSRKNEKRNIDENFKNEI